MLKKILKKLVPESILERRRKRQRDAMMDIFRNNPIELATSQYERVFHEKADMENPQDLIEKIIWLQFNTDTSLWTLCADKYRIRNFVEEKGLGEYLCKIYGMWKNADDINFAKLPEQFVLKTNNSCGQIILVSDKSQLDIPSTRKKLGRWMRDGYGFDNAQMHYTRIEPCIIAEELLPSPEGHSLIDYKIWCFDGKPECILVCYDRRVNTSGYALSMFDTKWHNISDRALNQDSRHFCGEDVPKPQNLDKMLEIASRLSENFPEVRVDLYNIDGRIVFGELTFTTGFGSYRKDFYEYLGSKIKLPR